MPSVKMLYLRDGDEYLSSRASRGALALHDKRHRDAGPLGTAHSYTPHGGVAPLFYWPKRPPYFATLADLLKEKGPKITSRSPQKCWMGPEYSFWPQPVYPVPPQGHKHDEQCTDLHRITPVECHKEVLSFYGGAYNANAIQKSTAQDQTGTTVDPIKIGVMAMIVLFALAALMMGVYQVVR